MSYELTLLKDSFAVAFFVSVICGIVGTLVYANRLTFLAGGIAHAAYGGIGLGIFFNTNVIVTTFFFTIVSSIIIGIMSLSSRDKTDNLVGLIWAGGMAFGILLLDLTPGYHTDIMSYLFGSIIIVSESSVLYMLFLTILICFVVGINYHKFVLISFDEEYAKTRGINVKFLSILMFLLIGIAIVMMIQIVGIVLVIALLSIPPYLASFNSNSLKQMMAYSTIWCITFSFLGIYIAYIFNLSSGASIIAVGIMLSILYNLFRRYILQRYLYAKK